MKAKLRAGLLLLLCCVGCQTSTGGALTRGPIDSDPLKGGGPPLPSGGGTAVARNERIGGSLASQGPGRATGPLPALPTPSGSTSPAALTSGNTSQLDQTAPPLRIGGDAAWRGPGETPRVTIQPPAPVGGFDTAPPVPLPGATQVAHLNGASVDQLLQSLRQRGALHPELRFTNGEWICTCRIPNRAHPNLLRHYEAAADTSSAAVQAVLEQLEKDKW